MFNLIANTLALSTISPAETGIIITLVVIILIAAVAYVYNYRCQLRVFFYMDTQGSVYNSKGLEIYLKHRRRRLKKVSLVVVDLKNIEFLYQNYSRKNFLVTSICDILLKGMTNVETLARVEFGKYICVYSEKSKSEIRDNCQELCKRFNDHIFEDYGKFNFDIDFAVYEDPDLRNPKAAIAEALAILRFSNVREGNIRYYSEEVDKSVKNLERINELKQAALDNKQFVSYIQPKVDFRTGRVVGGEILVRWIDENHNILFSPAEFIPLFEENGFIKEIDLLMFKNACELSRLMVGRGYNDIVISVNISKVLFNQSNFVEIITKICNEVGASPRNIELEITETTIMKDFQFISNCIMDLRGKGFKVAMDDFGQEYSSLSSLSNNPFDTIKLDQIFFKNRLSTEKSRYIVKNILDMLAKLKFEIVCEGVEDQATLDVLSQINRDIIIQGFCYSRPIQVNQFEAFASTTFKMDYPEIIDYKEEASKKESEVKSANSEIESLKQQMDEMKELFKKNLEEQRAAAQRQSDDMHRRDYYRGDSYYDPRDREIDELRRELEYARYRGRDSYDENYRRSQEDQKYHDIRREIDELKKTQEAAEKDQLQQKLEAERKERELLLKRIVKLETLKKLKEKKKATINQKEDSLIEANKEESELEEIVDEIDNAILQEEIDDVSLEEIDAIADMDEEDKNE